MRINKELSKGSNALMVLSVIARQDMYGYQIVKTIENASEDVFVLNEGTLYPILHALEQNGLLDAYWCEVDGRRRKYYRITEKGRKELARRRAEWDVFSGAVAKVLGSAELAQG
ncbi:MAG: helix-turn-helix transcriptional regulator [Clostridia bacterium]|nr:helix-turn-helix transcriptional regulator [Clostridia bacterium]